MVCLGNICRSPLAEGILKHKIDKRGLNWYVDSAGTSSWHEGEKPDARSIAVAKKNNVDITHQRSRQFSVEDFDLYDRIYTMDSENYDSLYSLAHTEDHRAKLELILNESTPGQNLPVPDPYWDDDGFDKVFAMLDEACESIVSMNNEH